MKWVVKKKREKGEFLESNRMEFDSQDIPHSIDRPIGANGSKKIKNEFNRGGNDL
jgi:hypothetical protein